MGKRRKYSIEKGIGFGVTSGVITTLGMMVGLDAGTSSSLAVIVGVFSVAIADALSDAMGMHTAEEVNQVSKKALWETTFSTFLSKLIFTLTFAIPVLLFELKTAILISIIWGAILIGSFSYYIATIQKKDPGKLITIHLFVTLLVIILTYFIGKGVGYLVTTML
tara:strand:- start:3059 stop:3553 length:495 start_codon:yes stop_codon:yes gene_type:complete